MIRGAAAFLSAFLLFMVQPVVGKRILPWFGGAAPVWTTCLVFFQGLVVVGYLYGHLLVRYVAPRWQSRVHVGVLVVSCLVLPIEPGERWRAIGEAAPLTGILGLLATSVGLPCLALSTTGPLLQVWAARDGKVPYGLFALSNVGSLAGLLGYPLVVEQALGARAQSVVWSAGYGLFVVLVGGLALRAGGSAGDRAGTDRGDAVESGAPGEPAPGVGRLALWGALAACPSILLVGMTRSLSLDVAPVPLLWVVPLAAYLLSYTLCFGRPAWCSRGLSAGMLLAGLAVALWLPPASPSSLDIGVRVAALVGGLFAFSTSGHAELVRARPGPAHLTTFYVMIALGGALGAVFAGVVAPAVFDSDLEVPVGVVLATGVFLFVHLPEQGKARARRGGASPAGRLVMVAVILPALGAVLLQDTWRQRAAAVAMGRSFYSTLRVSDTGEGPSARRTLSHGRTVHGQQLRGGARSRWPTAYYGETSGAGIALRLGSGQGGGQSELRARHVGIIGLGVGTLVTFGRPGDRYRIYEIDSLVIDFARRHFSYLAEAEAIVEIVRGDGRLALGREAPNGFDVLVVDAFSGDAIPAHLLTREAFVEYGRHLAADGILAVHTSNRYLDLASVVALSAGATGLRVALVRSDPDEDRGVLSSTWVLAAKGDLFAHELVARHGEVIEVPSSLRTWTDDHSSLVPILR